ncbi:MAG: glycoside hydrolase family 99-like domain-containing protein [Armatimonadota bacterium]|nr:glycoside hydrolase family 99-like domain-containing protein [Armatimonadota bacterium]
MSERCQVGVYYFPNYHVDPRNEQVHGPGWTEWELVKHARPRFPGHRQPRVPAWGYQDEADPGVMAKKIDVAAEHGVDFWIFDWYYYNDGPYLQRCLEEGYLHAPNNHRVKFCCMWANHDWTDIHPAKLREPRRVLYPGVVTPPTFEALTNHVVDRYFTHPSHFTVAGAPYFSIYDLTRFVASFGSVGAARAAVERFREKTRAAGFPDLHLNAVVWGRTLLPGESEPTDAAALVAQLGFSSVTSYVWIHHTGLPHFPQTPFPTLRDAYLAYWAEAEARFTLPYFPNVTVGWDSSPRTVQSDVFLNAGYPFTPVVSGNTPGQFRAALAVTRQRLQQRGLCPPLLTINAWNEWTEGSYLEPDTLFGMAYLEAIRDLFAHRAP